MAAFTYTVPTVGGSSDSWGATLNQNWADLSAFLGSLDSAELAVLDGITATTAEINYVAGVTSAIQTQIDAKYTATTQTEATWQAGTSTTESVVSPAKVKAAGATAFAANEQQLGVGQDWITVSRSAGVWYQNTTGKPIALQVHTNSVGSVGELDLLVGASTSNYASLQWGDGSSATRSNGIVVVPDQHFYMATGGDMYIVSARELR